MNRAEWVNLTLLQWHLFCIFSLTAQSSLDSVFDVSSVRRSGLRLKEVPMRSLIPWRRGEGTMRRAGQHPLSRLRDEMESMFEQFFGWPMSSDWGREQLWDMDMEEKPNEIVVRAEAPGF